MGDTTQVDSTPWFASKTLWVNAIAVVAIILQGITKHELLNLELQGTILGVINMVLRMVTNKPISWS